MVTTQKNKSALNEQTMRGRKLEWAIGRYQVAMSTREAKDDGYKTVTVGYAERESAMLDNTIRDFDGSSIDWILTSDGNGEIAVCRR